MSRKAHSILAPFLVITLVLTGQSMAVARGASAATGEMVLCIGVNTVTVYVDAQGHPTSAPHFCPECAFAGILAALDERVAPVLPTGFSFAVPTRQTSQHSDHLVALAYKSRAPPPLV